MLFGEGLCKCRRMFFNEFLILFAEVLGHDRNPLTALHVFKTGSGVVRKLEFSRVENVEDPLMQKIRFLDLLVDELARGKSMDRILRTPKA